MSDQPLFLGAAELRSLVSARECVDVLDRSLSDGSIDPELDSPRLFAPWRVGELLMMPSDIGGYSGVKVVTVAPDNPRAGHPKIQGVYALFDSAHLRPLALMDAAELTLARTSAVTALAVRHLLAASGRSGRIARLAVIGTGPQSVRHVEAIGAVAELAEVVVIGRRREAAVQVAGALSEPGYAARAGGHADLPHSDVIVCVTSSSLPVLGDSEVASDAIVCAVGTHGLERRELPAELILRSDVVVEGRASAMRESGNLIPARSAGEWSAQPLANLADLVAGRFVRRPGHPCVYSAVGMAWEDLVVAGYIYSRRS